MTGGRPRRRAWRATRGAHTHHRTLCVARTARRHAPPAWRDAARAVSARVRSDSARGYAAPRAAARAAAPRTGHGPRQCRPRIGACHGAGDTHAAIAAAEALVELRPAVDSPAARAEQIVQKVLRILRPGQRTSALRPALRGADPGEDAASGGRAAIAVAVAGCGPARARFEEDDVGRFPPARGRAACTASRRCRLPCANAHTEAGE